jgi:hypothetical protein
MNISESKDLLQLVNENKESHFFLDEVHMSQYQIPSKVQAEISNIISKDNYLWIACQSDRLPPKTGSNLKGKIVHICFIICHVFKCFIYHFCRYQGLNPGLQLPIMSLMHLLLNSIDADIKSEIGTSGGKLRAYPLRVHVEEAGADAKLIQVGALGVAYNCRHPISTVPVTRITHRSRHAACSQLNFFA